MGWEARMNFNQTMPFHQDRYWRNFGKSTTCRKQSLHVDVGKAPLEPESALQFEKIFSVDADTWLNIEQAYRLRLSRTEAASESKT